jgi:hypothetical protein
LVLQISARVAAIVTLIAMLPCLISLWKRPGRERLVRACAYAALCGFMFGFHVHEKASLTFVLLMSLEAFTSPHKSRCAAHCCSCHLLSHLAHSLTMASPLPQLSSWQYDLTNLNTWSRADTQYTSQANTSAVTFHSNEQQHPSRKSFSALLSMLFSW